MSASADDSVLKLVGLGARGRLVVIGVDMVRNAAQRGKLQLALVAQDASRNSLDKVVPLLQARGVPMIEVQSAEQLGAAVGKGAVAVVGVSDVALAKGILKSIVIPAKAGIQG